MAEWRVPACPDGASPSSRPPRRRRGEAFLRALLRDNALWVAELASDGEPPRGWRPLIIAALVAIGDAMADAPGCRVDVRLARAEGRAGRLRVEVGDSARPIPPSVMRRVQGIVEAAGRDSSKRCPRCGKLVGSAGGVADHLATAPTCAPSPIMAAILARVDEWATEGG